MYRNTYRFAEVPFEAVYESEYITRQCAEYLTDEEPQFSITLTKEDVEKEHSFLEMQKFPYGYLESLALYRKFCEKVASQKIILFHSSAIEVDGKAYLFTAPSGTGKSTHTRLWREMLGEKAIMVNDDKPLLKIENGKVTVFGTPYDGKEHLSTNKSAPVAGICFLSQAKENKIERIPMKNALPKLLSQTYRPYDNATFKDILSLVVSLSAAVPVWHLACNISEEAAKLSYETMKEGTT